jgi:hypothetical protein
VLLAGDCEVTDDVQGVSTPDGPPRDDTDDGLGDVTDESLDLEDVEATGAGGVAVLV